METAPITLHETAQLRNRDLLLTALQQLGVTRVLVTYTGGGDSGDDPDFTAEPPELIPQLRQVQITQLEVRPDFELDGGKTKQLVEVTKTLAEALCDFALDWTDMHHGGWYNDDGGAGSLTVDVAGHTFALEHVAYYTESTRYEYAL
ncbi:MAG: DUF6878 family protein [Pseudomonadota bacterium]